ncbi:auxin-induced in root cultures protein 12-like [Bidens hawaiensis]|uniref:auxin-induced in root cultures protein 12-like n=1 Tax=Bidens hawaiensis TaxID=980011 RepID=UPI004049AABA
MAGAQSFIAFKGSNGSMTVKTYNISSYSSIVEGKIAFEVPEASAEFSGGVMRIFATMKLPEAMTEVNHIWPEFMGCLLLFLDGWRGGSRRAETDSKLDRILKLVKSVNSGNKDQNKINDSKQ